jgi:MYXO-CTERM domain-containing protein
MVGPVVLAIAMGFVYGGDDATMARELDAQSLGNADYADVGFVVSYGDGVSLRVPVQPLAGMSSTSLGPPRPRNGAAPSREGGVALAVALLEREDASRKLLVMVGDHVIPWRLRDRIAADHIEVELLDGDPPVVEPRRDTSPGSTSSAPPRSDPSWQPLAALALLGLAAALARRSA